MIERANDIGVGDRVTYLPGGAPATRHCLQQNVGHEKVVHGHVVAPPVPDPYTAVVWLPTRPDGAADDVEPTWVRHDRVVDFTHPPLGPRPRPA
ncbi:MULTISPECIES: hypothetical protein [Prauserella salsuginis group]|uniref:Nitrile hydratase beta subunit domain-containing protein n=2 Tax=Prauserella salsuginis group TaxID=2893672 RepID=A0A839XP71_9PSEU|nr:MULTISPECIES: hypothetical protein [Prauserella salsuginis group]MBB3665642.1 hypothetical protein [Prauserella sediminis]MCR3718090.1 hypothetical protein [Prauserella flava]MCR3732660.1 hypothetical protein [Prauserella salsuginis]